MAMSRLLHPNWIRSIAISCIWSTVVFPAFGVANADDVRRFATMDMLDIVEIPDDLSDLSSDGDLFAFVYPNVKDDANVLTRRPIGNIHVADLSRDALVSGAQTLHLTESSVRSSFPSWSPDTRRLAYFVGDSSGFHLELFDSETGDKKRVSSRFLGEPNFAAQWGSEGKYVVFARPDEPGTDGGHLFLPPPTFASAAREHESDEFPRVVVVDSKDQRIPGDSAFINDHKVELIAVNLSNGKATQLTDGPVHLRDFKISPGEGYVIFTAPTEDSFGLIGEEVTETFLVPIDGSQRPRSLASENERLEWNGPGDRLLYLKEGDLHSIDLSGERLEVFTNSEVAAQEVSIKSFVPAPEGRWLAALVADQSYNDPEIERPKDDMYTISQPFMNLYLVDLDTGSIQNVTSGMDINVDVSDPVWTADSNSIVFKGRNPKTYEDYIFRYEMDHKRLDRLTTGEEAIGKLRLKGNTLLFSAETASHPQNFYKIDLDEGTRHQVTELNPQLTEFKFSVPDLIDFINNDGEEMQALLYKPVDVDASKDIPVITYVYEKLTPQRYQFQSRHQIFLNHGFAVLMPNVKIKVGEPGTSFVENVVPATTAVREMGFTNGRFSIWGGSFGAYATSFIITQTNAFECAVARATPPELFNNWASGRDRDSRNIESGQARIGGHPYEVMERYLAQSAFFHLDKVETPVLIMHGAQDETILFDEGEMFFYALRELGKEATLVAYTHGDHSLYRRSRADAVDVHQRLLGWFGDCLK